MYAFVYLFFFMRSFAVSVELEGLMLFESREIHVPQDMSWPMSVELPLRMGDVLPYVYWVSFHNVAGYGARSSHSGGLPSAPSSMQVNVSGPRAITANIGYPLEDGTFEVTHYWLRVITSTGNLLLNVSLSVATMEPLGTWEDPALHSVAAPFHRVVISNITGLRQASLSVQGRAINLLGAGPPLDARGKCSHFVLSCLKIKAQSSPAPLSFTSWQSVQSGCGHLQSAWRCSSDFVSAST
jgi:hypothetical protein